MYWRRLSQRGSSVFRGEDRLNRDLKIICKTLKGIGKVYFRFERFLKRSFEFLRFWDVETLRIGRSEISLYPPSRDSRIKSLSAKIGRGKCFDRNVSRKDVNISDTYSGRKIFPGRVDSSFIDQTSIAANR